MIAPLAKFIDECVFQANAVRLSFRKVRMDDSKLADAIEFLNGPNFIRAESKPAGLEFTSKIHFQFPSPQPCEFAENNVVHGRLYRRAKDWQRFPTVILLHGGGDSLSHRFGFPLKVPVIHRAGFNAAILVAPYAFQRRVRRIEKLDHLLMVENIGQAVAEIRALVGWLLGQGCPSVALIGLSLGGWFAGITATRDSRLAAIVLAMPRVRWELTRELPQVRSLTREAFEDYKTACRALDRTPTNLTLTQPVIPKEHILLIQGRYDLVVAEHAEKLCQAWKQPEIWRLPHSHVSGIFSPGITSRVLDWLAPRMKK